jgi:hypothetical protein
MQEIDRQQPIDSERIRARHLTKGISPELQLGTEKCSRSGPCYVDLGTREIT